ncbi:MAG: serine/threonine-protein kinase [Anaerolineaceae bacterium]
MTFSIGENIGPYRILEQLGQGGMATVYKAYHPALDRYVALKVLHPAFKEDANFLGRFQREAKLVAKLEHPNIVPIYDFAEHEGHPYLVIKFIEGETLKARLIKGRLNDAEILKITKAVGAALSYAHNKGILHRDIKPSNVLLTPDGQIYLADFGLARLAAASDSTLSSDILIGTPQYISPEQANGVKDLDVRSDVYCFGVMLYEMMVGRVPFNADTPYAIVHDHIYKPLPLPRKLNPSLSEEMEVVLLKALAKDRNDRFPNVAALVKAFETALTTPPAERIAPATVPSASRAVVEEPQPATKPASKPVKPVKQKGRSCWVVGAWVGLVLIVLMAILFVIRAGRTLTGNRAGAILTPVAATLTSLPPPANLEQLPALAVVNEALAAFQNNDMDEFWNLVRAVEGMAGDKADLYRQAGDQMVGQQAYFPAAVFYLQVFRYDPSILKPEQAIRLRQVIFQEARNPKMGGLFQGTRDDPLYLIVLSRYEVFNKADWTSAKDRIGRLVGDPKIVKAYPEANLVMAEIYVKLNDFTNARQLLNSTISNTALPDWVRDDARNLLTTLPK